MIALQFPWKQSSCCEGYLIKLLTALDAQPKKRLLKGTLLQMLQPLPPPLLKQKRKHAITSVSHSRGV